MPTKANPLKAALAAGWVQIGPEDYQIVTSWNSSFFNGGLPVITAYCLIFILLLMPASSMAETYKYVDEKGAVHFVDSLDKIPPQYRKEIQILPEIKDRRSEEKSTEKSKFEKFLLGRWEYKGEDPGEPYTVIMSIRPKGVFDGNGYGKFGDKTRVWMYKGNWKIEGDKLVLTYSWSSASEPKAGTTDRDQIIEATDKYLELKSGRTGKVIRYIRK